MPGFFVSRGQRRVTEKSVVLFCPFFFFLFPFFFPTYGFHIVKMVQDGSSNGQTMRLELPTQNGHAYIPKHSTGPRTGPRAAAGCQDAGPPQDLGPPPGCPSPAPSQQLAVSCLSPLDNFSRRIHILFAVFDLVFRNFPALSRPTSTPLSKDSYQLSKRQFRLQMLLTGSEGQAAMHQPPDVFLLSLPFSFILLHCSNRGQELKQTFLIPAPVILLLLRKATVEAEMERSTAGSWRSTFSVLQSRWGGNAWQCAAGKSADGERLFPNLCLLCSTYMMQSQPFHKHIFRLWVKFHGSFAIIPEACLIYSYFPPEHMEGHSSSVNNIWKQRHYAVRDSHNIN